MWKGAIWPRPQEKKKWARAKTSSRRSSALARDVPLCGSAQGGQVVSDGPACLSYEHGLPLWGYPVQKGTVLGMDGTNDLLFAIHAKQLGVGPEGQLKMFVRQHPDTKLIIIDTLQKVREAGGDKYS